MEEGQNQTNYKIRFNKLAIGFIIIQVVFIVFLAISIPQLSQPDEVNDEDPSRIPVAMISNFDSVVPENYSGKVNLIETTLFQLILRNSLDGEISKSVDVVVREDSVKNVYFKNQNINYFSAIVDVPDLEQSYWFYSEYSDDSNNRYIDYSKAYRIFCLEDSEEILYPNFECEDGFGLNGRYELVSDLISHFEFDGFAPLYSYERGFNEIGISPHTFDELSDSTKELYIQQVKDAIASLGVSPDIFTYYVLNPDEIRYYYPLGQ